MKKEIIICPKCDNHKIKDYFDRSEQRYKCLSCGRSFKDTTKKTRTVVDSDYFIVKTDEDKKIGFIAQDWKDDFPAIINEDEEGLLGMKYTETIPVLLKAIQELKAEIELLKIK